MNRIKRKNRTPMPEKLSPARFANLRDKINKLNRNFTPVGASNNYHHHSIYDLQETSPDSRKDIEVSLKYPKSPHKEIRSYKSIRAKNQDSPESLKTNRNSVDLYDKIKSFQVPRTRIRTKSYLFKGCKQFIDVISEFIKNRKNNKSIEDLRSMRYYERRIIEHCRRDSINLKANPKYLFN